MAEPDSFMSHLIELRDRLLRCVLALLLVFICLFPWARDLYAMLAQPIGPLPPSEKFLGAGIYALYYSGTHAAYTTIAMADKEGRPSTPIYSPIV